MFLSFYAEDGNGGNGTSPGQFLGSFHIRQLLRGQRETAVQNQMIEGFRDKGGDLPFPLNQQRKSRGHNSANGKGAVIGQGKESGGVDAHKPVRFHAAQSAFVQTIVVAARLQIRKSFPDGVILHRGDPQSFHGLAASSQIIHGAEDQLSFTTSVAGVDDFCDVALTHQRVENIELLLLILLDTESEAAGQNGQVVHIPLGEAFLIEGGICQLCQMTITPGNEIAVALQIASSLLTAGSNDCGNGFCHRGFFSNDQFIFAHTPSWSDAGSYCSNSAYSPSSSSSPKS